MSSGVTVFGRRAKAGRHQGPRKRIPLAVRVANALVAYGELPGRGALAARPWQSSIPTHLEWAGWDSRRMRDRTGLVTVFVLREINRSQWLAAGWLWYIGTLVPVIGIVQVGRPVDGDRYTTCR